jgi:hypothetical protein
MVYFDRTVTRINLKSDPSLWVDLYTSLNWAEAKIFYEAENGISRADLLLPKLIKEWNLTEGEAIAPIDGAHIDLLENDDISVLINYLASITTVSADEKKSSSKPPTKP